MEQLESHTHPSLGSHMGSLESALSARATAGKHTGWSGRIIMSDEPGGTPGVRREACLQPCDDGGYVTEHPAASSGSASYCLRIALSSRRGGGGREAAAGRTRPLLSALSNHSAAPLGAAAARCLRTDYVAFRCGRKNYQDLQGSFVLRV